MAVTVKHGGIMRQEQERLLEISFGWQSGPVLPSQRYLQERLRWLLFQQYLAMLFHRLPAFARIGRACQHHRTGNLCRSSIGRQSGGRGGERERDAVVEAETKDTIQKGFFLFGKVAQCTSANMILSFSLSLQLPQSLCCANLPTEGRRNAKARASTLRMEGRGTEKAR